MSKKPTKPPKPKTPSKPKPKEVTRDQPLLNDPPEAPDAGGDEAEENPDSDDDDAADDPLAEPEDYDELGVLGAGIGVTGPESSTEFPARWPTLDDAVAELDRHFSKSHGLSVDVELVKEFIAFYRTPPL